MKISFEEVYIYILFYFYILRLNDLNSQVYDCLFLSPPVDGSDSLLLADDLRVFDDSIDAKKKYIYIYILDEEEGCVIALPEQRLDRNRNEVHFVCPSVWMR